MLYYGYVDRIGQNKLLRLLNNGVEIYVRHDKNDTDFKPGDQVIFNAFKDRVDRRYLGTTIHLRNAKNFKIISRGE